MCLAPRKLEAHERGAATVEAALLFALVLAPLTLGVIELTNFHAQRLEVESTAQQINATLNHDPMIARWWTGATLMTSEVNAQIDL